MIRRTARDQEWDRLGARAVQVWGECAATGFVLAGAGAFVAVAVAILVEGASTPVVAYFYTTIAAGYAGVCGLLVGMVVGIPVGLLVRYGEPRIGSPAVARLIPVVAVTMTTLPFLIVFARVGAPAPAFGVFILDAVFTLVGALWIARRYLRRSEQTRVH